MKRISLWPQGAPMTTDMRRFRAIVEQFLKKGLLEGNFYVTIVL